MLKSITLENYKCFKDETDFEIAPLTILCGVNSSGKSSVLKSLLMLKQTVEKESPYNKLSFIGDYVDNGYFEDVINSNGLKEGKDAFTISNKFVLKKFDENSKKRQDMSSFKELKRLYYKMKKIDYFEIIHKVVVKKPSKNSDDADDFGNYIENNEVIKTSITIRVFTEKKLQIETSISITKNVEKSYYLLYQNLPVLGDFVSISEQYPNGYSCQCYFDNIKLTNIYKNNIPHKIVNAKTSVLALFNIASRQYSGINFIAPLRQYPLRNYAIRGDVNSVGISGENAPVLYTKLCGKSYITTDVAIPEENENCNYNNDTKNNFKCLDEPMSFKKSVQKWMDYFDLGKISVKGKSGLLELKINNHNISDVGFGVSQIFPIIVQALQMPKDEVLLLEQPEIHLHPQMQMRMADFLLAVASSERNIIVETHSDHIINRITRRLMENPHMFNEVKIYFVSKDSENNSQKEEIEINLFDGAICENENFFYQYASETERIIDVGYKNLQAKQQQGD